MSFKCYNDNDDDDEAVDDANQKMMTMDLKDRPNDDCLGYVALDASYKDTTVVQNDLSQTYKPAVEMLTPSRSDKV